MGEVLFLIVLVVRGLTAGTIVGLAMMIPMKEKIGVRVQAAYLSEMYRGVGPRIYGTATVLMIIALAMLSWWALASRGSDVFSYLLLASLCFTGLSFVGTFFSLRAMHALWSAKDQNERQGALIDRFAGWHVYGAVCHSAAFIALCSAAPLL